MKKNFLFTAIILLAGMLQNTFSQQRYLDEVFTGVNPSYNIEYGQNFTVLYDPTAPVLQDLVMDVYEPYGDTLQARPLVVYIHTGQFLPLLLNTTPSGDKADSATVEMCRQFAKRGYVACSMDYRTGWSPGGSTQDIRTGTILMAVYRAIQDAKACVRYFRMDASVQGNTFKIDTNRIILCGQGSGGYVALAYNSLDKVSETQLLKFIAAETNSTYGFVAGQSYVDQSLWGDFDGFGGAAGMNNENWPGYSNKVKMVVNMGGAIGDSTWIEAGDAPIVAFHPVNDPFAPYKTGPVIVPTTGQFVIEVSGSYDVIRICNDPSRGNNNAVFVIPYNDPYTTRANS
ncbi:MAG: alpha/beta hydrolase, partial [Chitinophagales bacterium]